MAIKDYHVTFDALGNVLMVTDITNPDVPQRPLSIVVKASTLTKATSAAKALYSLAK